MTLTGCHEEEPKEVYEIYISPDTHSNHLYTSYNTECTTRSQTTLWNDFLHAFTILYMHPVLEHWFSTRFASIQREPPLLVLSSLVCRYFRLVWNEGDRTTHPQTHTHTMMSPLSNILKIDVCKHMCSQFTQEKWYLPTYLHFLHLLIRSQLNRWQVNPVRSCTNTAV